MKFKTILLAAVIASATIGTAQARDPAQEHGGMMQPHGQAQEQANEKLVTTFYQKLFGDKDVSAIDEYIVEDYIQHNPGVADGRAAIKAAATQWLVGTPKEKVDIVHSAAKGAIVFLHVRGKRPDGGVQAIVDIFRVSKGKIVEHWDVIQDAPANAANAHPMF